MLHYGTIEKPTLELLINLQKLDIFSEMRLVGGTALALHLGHRKSVDLDLFGALEEDENEVNSELARLGQITQLRNTKNIRVYLIDGIKVDIVNYQYPWLHEPVVKDNLRLAHRKDIAAMKIAAITGRGSKKDFIDIYFLLKENSLQSIMEAYKQKYHDGSIFMALKSLVYFEDAEEDEMPVMMESVIWDEVKSAISDAHKSYVGDISGNLW